MSPSVRAGFWAGFAAGGIAVAAITLGLFTGGLPVLALAMWERTLRLIPMDLFAFFIVRLKFAAKPAAYWGMLAAAVLGWGLLGAALSRPRWGARSRLIAAWTASAALLAVVTSGPATAALQARRASSGDLTSGAPAVALAIATVALIYAVLYAGILAARGRRAPAVPAVTGGRTEGEGGEGDGHRLRRREVLQRAVVLALAGTAGTAAVRLARAAGRAAAAAQSLFARVSGLPPEITPNDRFYVVSKNPPGFDPRLSGDSWVLRIDGLVARPTQLSLPQLRALSAVEQFQTLECISNEVGGDLIGNAKWKGVRLRDLLARAGGPAATAVRVAFHCADGYTEAIPLADALAPTTLLAYEMNGEPLPPEHGFPARLLVPGLYGMKNPKWITRIEVVDFDFQGYWEKSGWSDDAVVKTMSRITTLQRTHPLGEIPVGGVAYAGDRGIRGVEYSVDGGKTWEMAEVKPALGPFTWVLWAAVWTPAGPGEYTVKARARDGGGVLQIAREAPPLPDGASGYHTLRVRVRR